MALGELPVACKSKRAIDLEPLSEPIAHLDQEVTMRHLVFACSLSIGLPAAIQAQIIREPVSLTAPVGQSAHHFSQEADGPDAGPAAEVHHVSERVPESATGGHTRTMGLLRDYRFQASPRIVYPRNPLAFGMPLESRGLGVSRQQPPQASRERSTRRKVFGAIVGGVGGFFGGTFLGAAIEGDRCNCDDPGLVGALIGGPVGAVAGGVLGYKFLF